MRNLSITIVILAIIGLLFGCAIAEQATKQTQEAPSAPAEKAFIEQKIKSLNADIQAAQREFLDTESGKAWQAELKAAEKAYQTAKEAADKKIMKTPAAQKIVQLRNRLNFWQAELKLDGK